MVVPKPVPVELAEAIVKASRNLDRSRQEFELAVVAALRSGASMRLTAEIAGVAYGTVQAIAKRHGWPDAAEKRRRAKETAERQKWRDLIQHVHDERFDQ